MAKNAATAWAVANGAETLGMTAAGETATTAASLTTWAEQRPIWAAAARVFAQGAAGDVNVFLSPYATSTTIWVTEEYGTLLANPSVTNIWFHLVW